MHVVRGGGGIRLLDEAFNRVHAVLADRVSRKDVAVAGLRLGRLDAEGDDASGLGGCAPGEAGGAKFRRIENDVVGGQRQHHGLRVALERHRGRGGDRRPRISPQRLDHDRCLDADLFGLAAREEVEIRSGDDDGRGEHRIAHPQQGLLIGRPIADQRQELLGQGVAGDRPEPRSGAAGKQDRNDRRGHGSGEARQGYLFWPGIVLSQSIVPDYRYRCERLSGAIRDPPRRSGR